MEPVRNISFQKIFLYTLFIIAYLATGSFLKEAIVIIVLILAVTFFITKHYNYLLFLLILWSFTYKFFIGQGFIHGNTFNSAIDKIMYLFLLIVYIKDMKYTGVFFKKLINIHIIFFVFLIFSFFLNQYNFFRVFNRFTYFFLFIIIYQSNFLNKWYFNIICLIFAIGIVQILVGYAQYSGIINPPQRFVEEISGAISEHIAGLDDAASGTFGAYTSNDTSWFLSFLSLLSVSFAFFYKNIKFILLAGFLLLQYAFVDSKTAITVTIIMFAIFFYYSNKYKYSLKIKTNRIILYFILIIGFGFGLINLWSGYYKTIGTNFNKITEVSYKATFNTVLNNIDKWGKFKGFEYVAEEQYKEHFAKVFLGFGIGQYTWANRMHKIEQKDYYLMKLNNITRSRSSFIKHFAETGITGMILLFIIYFYIWKWLRLTTFATTFGKTIKLIYKPFLITSFIFAFLYGGININSFSISAFWIFLALAFKFEKIYKSDKTKSIIINKN
jgi:hypothetical protein